MSRNPHTKRRTSQESLSSLRTIPNKIKVSTLKTIGRKTRPQSQCFKRRQRRKSSRPSKCSIPSGKACPPDRKTSLYLRIRVSLRSYQWLKQSVRQPLHHRGLSTWGTQSFLEVTVRGAFSWATTTTRMHKSSQSRWQASSTAHKLRSFLTIPSSSGLQRPSQHSSKLQVKRACLQ